MSDCKRGVPCPLFVFCSLRLARIGVQNLTKLQEVPILDLKNRGPGSVSRIVRGLLFFFALKDQPSEFGMFASARDEIKQKSTWEVPPQEDCGRGAVEIHCRKRFPVAENLATRTNSGLHPQQRL